MRGALLSTGARVLTMAVSLLCGVLTARLILGQGGVEYYAFFSLLVALPGLLSFSDLGTGAVVVNSISSSRDIHSDDLLTRQVVTVMRVQLMFAGALLSANLVLLLTGAWSILLGAGARVPHADLAAFSAVSIFSLSICLGIWVRVLLGLGRNPVVILLQGLVSPLSLLLVWLMLTSGIEQLKSFLAMSSFTAAFASAVIGFAVASRLSGRLLPTAARRVLHPRRFPGAKVMDVGWPMLAQLLSTPLAMSLPRFVLAQSATAVAVAQYAVAGQVFFALQALVSAAGVALWPAFNRARSRGTLRRGPYLVSATFGAGIAAVTVVILLIGPWLFGLISDGTLIIGTDLILAFGAMITIQALLYPLGMFIMDKRGIRFQVLPALGMAASTVALTVIAVPLLGVLAPPLANAVSVLVFQVVPFTVYIHRHRRRLYGAGTGAVEA